MKKYISLLLGLVLIISMGSSFVYAFDGPQRVIFGDDDRVIITNTTRSPYNAVANLTIKYKKGGTTYTRYGTGFLISPDTIATAAHIIYDKSEGFGKAVSITVKLGDTPKSDPYGSQTVTSENLTCHSKWLAGGNYLTYDLGVIKLKNPVKNVTPLRISAEGASVGETVKISGYDWITANQWLCSGKVMASFSNALDFHIDTKPGMSGSPVYNEDGTVIAIYTNGPGGGDNDLPDSSDKVNTASRITEEALTFFNDHM